MNPVVITNQLTTGTQPNTTKLTIPLTLTTNKSTRTLQNTPNFAANMLNSLKVLILDEADQLLEMGFKPEIDKIMSFMPPKENRLTLLFSATVPKAVQVIAKNALRTNYTFVDTVGEEADQTHSNVRQEIVVSTPENTIGSLATLLRRHMDHDQNYKVIVFFTTARVTGFMAEIFTKMGVFGEVLEIHSRISQSKRTKTSEKFKKSRSAIMFTSDVSARGMDYPDVSFVLQVGLTEREQYIHRLGRTARAGKSGSGLLLLAPYEERTMRKALNDMNLLSLQVSAADVAAFEGTIANALGMVERDSELKKSAQQAYGAWLGFYNGNLRKCGWDKRVLVEVSADA